MLSVTQTSSLDGSGMIAATWTGSPNGNARVSVSSSAPNSVMLKQRTYFTLLRKIAGQAAGRREQSYIATYRVSIDEVNDPDGFVDQRTRRIVSAVAAGFSLETAKSSLRFWVSTITNGVPTFTTNCEWGMVSAYYEGVSRAALGLPKNLSEKKSGRKRSRPKKFIRRWGIGKQWGEV